MRSLYWKIFLSFWIASIVIIITIAWVTNEIARTSSIPSREVELMDSYANAAVATFESGKKQALTQLFKETRLKKELELFLLTHHGLILGSPPIPEPVKQVSRDFVSDKLDEGIYKSGSLIVSHEIISTTGNEYRLAAVSEKPLVLFSKIPWPIIFIRLLIAIIFSGLVCYILSRYLTKPLRSLSVAAKALAKGELKTRVGEFSGHGKDEIAELSFDFDSMAEQLETLLYSKERLMQDISHELRSPLARLHIAIELGRKKCGDHAIDEFQRMEEECIRLNELIGEILDYAKLDKSTATLNKTIVNLSKLLKTIRDDANYEFSTDKERVVMGKIEPIALLADERLLHRAIENILRNALRYSPKNKEVFISLYRRKVDKNIAIVIEDSGPGVPTDQLTTIFDPFYRVDSARTKATGGFGLGLTIAKQAIELHGGCIRAENRAQGGLAVEITLSEHL